MMKTEEMLMLDKNLLRNHLYNTFVFPQRTEQNNMKYDIEIEVHYKIIITPKTIFHKIEIALVMTRILLLHNTLNTNLTIINETRDIIALFIDPHTNHLIDVILVTDIDHAKI